jgi:hypothetical protein
MTDHVVLSTLKHEDIANKYRIKRMGKDKDPIFWTIGKIHGLENLAFCDPEEV